MNLENNMQWMNNWNWLISLGNYNLKINAKVYKSNAIKIENYDKFLQDLEK